MYCSGRSRYSLSQPVIQGKTEASEVLADRIFHGSHISEWTDIKITETLQTLQKETDDRAAFFRVIGYFWDRSDIFFTFVHEEERRIVNLFYFLYNLIESFIAKA